MKVARFHAPGDIRLEDSPEPVTGPGEVKIRVRNCSTCGTDAKIYRFGHHHIRPPRVMGHEIAEEIVAVGGPDDVAKPRRPRAGNRHPQLDDLAARLSDRFDTRVNIALGQRKGKLTVEFASVEDLNRIVDMLGLDRRA